MAGAVAPDAQLRRPRVGLRSGNHIISTTRKCYGSADGTTDYATKSRADDKIASVSVLEVGFTFALIICVKYQHSDGAQEWGNYG